MRAGTSTPDSLDELLALQQRLLRLAAQSLRPGGTLAYVTCSWLKAKMKIKSHTLCKSRALPCWSKMLGAPLQRQRHALCRAVA